jgi:hypothetical protein
MQNWTFPTSALKITVAPLTIQSFLYHTMEYIEMKFDSEMGVELMFMNM